MYVLLRRSNCLALTIMIYLEHSCYFLSMLVRISELEDILPYQNLYLVCTQVLTFSSVNTHKPSYRHTHTLSDLVKRVNPVSGKTYTLRKLSVFISTNESSFFFPREQFLGVVVRASCSLETIAAINLVLYELICIDLNHT